MIARRYVVALLVAAIYIVACATPAVEFSAKPPATDFGDLRFLPDYEAGPQLGLVALALGWQTPWTIAWSANVALFFGVLLLMVKKNRGAFVFGVGAALLALSTWAIFEFDDRLMRLLVGYYFWQASTLALIAGAGILFLQQPKLGPTPVGPG